jgi:hypothetical protein
MTLDEVIKCIEIYPVTRSSVVVIRCVEPLELVCVKEILRLLKLTHPSWAPLVIVVQKDTDIQFLNDDEMADAGWMRIPKGMD